MSKLDFRKPHVIHGAGPGADVVCQGGKYFERSGGQLSPNVKEIAEAGIPVTNELHIHLKIQKEEAQFLTQKAEIERKMANMRKELERRVAEGLPLDDPIDEETNEMALKGLEELQNSLEPNRETSRVRKKGSKTK